MRRTSGSLWALGLTGLALLVVTALSIPEAGDTLLSIPEAILLGIVEGVTEFLPISSTGHLTVTQDLLGLTATEASKDAADAYAIAIQAGAIVAVVGIYRARLANSLLSLAGRGADPAGGRRVAAALAISFVPAATVGLLLGQVIKDNLFGPWPVVGAWVLGGLVILAWPRISPHTGRPLEVITARDAAIVGVVQILALWPGVSRSLVVILAALAIGMTLAASVEFAFLLGLVTLGAATVYESVGKGGEIVDQFGVGPPIVGFVAAFVSAAAAVVWMVSYVQDRGLRIFGWYRIAVAAVVAVLALTVL